MTSTRHILAGGIAGAACGLIDELFIEGPVASSVALLLGASVVLVGVIRGRKGHPFLRALTSVGILYWAYGTCLAGRTMEPGLTLNNFGYALTIFLLFGLAPASVLLRLWAPPFGVRLLLACFPVAFLLAALVAGTEEYLFVRKYRETGIGPTLRWTVPQHWLSYDQERQLMCGSD